MKNEMISKIGLKFNKMGFCVKKHSPEILITVGVAGVVASAVFACKQTTKVHDILSKTKEDLDTIHEFADSEDAMYEESEYTEEDKKKDIALVYAQTGLKIAKLYAVPALLGAASITCIVCSHGILKNRNANLAAAYIAVDKGFKAYKKRIVEKLGEDAEREIRYGIHEETIKKDEVDSKTGEVKEVETVEKVISKEAAKACSPFSVLFDETTSKSWKKNSEYNLMFLKAQQSIANNMLKARGYLFLNEVYDLLDIPAKTKAGQVVGWIYDPNDENRENYVDFGIYVNDLAHTMFVDGDESSIWLDFNVDGNILNDLEVISSENY